MNKSIRFLVMLSVMFMLEGCGPQYQTTYSYTPPHSWNGRQCVNQCLTNRSYCRSQCQANAQSCQTNANLMAMPAYLSYVQQQNSQNQPVFNSVSDYADYSGCSDRCGCEASYRDCFVNCGGRVYANTQCVAFCPQVRPVAQ